MNIPFCDLEEPDGLDITEYESVSVWNSQAAYVVHTGGGSFTNVLLVRALIYNAEGLLVNNLTLQQSGKTFGMRLYSNCDNTEGIIGGENRTNPTTPSQYNVPEGGRVVITNIGAAHRLFGWATLVYYVVSVRAYSCSDPNSLIGWIEFNGNLNSFRRNWFQYKIFGSGMYGNKPNKWHAHSIQLEDNGETVYYDVTGTQANIWGAEVVETDLSGETEESRQILERLSYIYREIPDLVTN